MEETVESIKKKLILYGILSVLCFFPPALSICIDLMPDKENLASWFQRSGSIMVVLAVWAEFKLLAIEGYISPSGTAYVVPFDTPAYFKTLYKVVSVTLVVAIIIGTVIWGYGDLLIRST